MILLLPKVMASNSSLLIKIKNLTIKAAIEKLKSPSKYHAAQLPVDKLKNKKGKMGQTIKHNSSTRGFSGSGGAQQKLALLDAGKPLKMAGNFIIVFDFDRTLIDDDSDRWVINNMGLTRLYHKLRPTLPWNALMDRMLEELYIQGKTVDEIAECLKTMPLHPNVIAAIKSAHDLGCDLKIVSDSNQFYIKTILEHYGIYSCFSEITTNPAVLENGRLRVFPYHKATSSHGCDLCPPNLCKGRVISEIQASICEGGSKRIIYIGDGMNDFCPTLKLVAEDCVMPRKNFSLLDRILKNSQLVKAKVYEWDEGEDLARTLLNLIN